MNRHLRLVRGSGKRRRPATISPAQLEAIRERSQTNWNAMVERAAQDEARERQRTSGRAPQRSRGRTR
jgi:hypothetical protein